MISIETLIKMVEEIAMSIIPMPMITETEMAIGIITINKDQNDKTTTEYKNRTRETQDI